MCEDAGRCGIVKSTLMYVRCDFNWSFVMIIVGYIVVNIHIRVCAMVISLFLATFSFIFHK